MLKTYLSIFIFTFLIILCAGSSSSAQILETKDFEMKNCIQLFGRDDFVIKTQDELLKAIGNNGSLNYCLKNLEKIDFSKNSLLGTNLNTGYCREPVGLIYQAVNNEKEKIYSINITYFKPPGLCRALSSYDLWILVPKLPDKYEVKFDVKAVSPDDN